MGKCNEACARLARSRELTLQLSLQLFTCTARNWNENHDDRLARNSHASTKILIILNILTGALSYPCYLPYPTIRCLISNANARVWTLPQLIFTNLSMAACCSRGTDITKKLERIMKRPQTSWEECGSEMS